MKGKATQSIYISRDMVWRHGWDPMKDCFTCIGRKFIVKH
jgi:hypothetical protein